MLRVFFSLAARSPGRQRVFRRAVAAHLLILGVACWPLVQQGPCGSPVLLGHVLLLAGIVEGAMLVGWRLTQLPKSQALEFLLVSPLRPQFVLLAEAAVGLAQLALVTLSGLAVMALLVGVGLLDPLAPAPLLLMPWTWGAVAGLGLTLWAYEPLVVRRRGEWAAGALVVLYLAIGVLAGENLKCWLDGLPWGAGEQFIDGFNAFHRNNPFAVLQLWLEYGVRVAWERSAWLEGGALAAAGLFLWRTACRLQAHFHELHYQPAINTARMKQPPVGDRPLSWWAVKRVLRYSGRLNLWLAGGFGLVYALYTAAGPNWPPWLGQRVFQIVDAVGGIPAVTTGLVVLAAVPAAFQYGLWDANAQNRCRRLELLLLARLEGRDYWDAAWAAAWRRGRGYFAVALVLWAAAVVAGQLSVVGAFAAAAAGVLLWALYFALGFRAFARGVRANGLGLILAVGLPMTAFAFDRLGWPAVGALTPPGAVYYAQTDECTLLWAAGLVLAAGLMLAVGRRALRTCDRDLRAWYDRSHGAKVLG
jgi:hypothetical protein